MSYKQQCTQCNAKIKMYEGRWIDATYEDETEAHTEEEAINYAAWCTMHSGDKENIDIYENENEDYDHKPDALVRLVMGE